MDAIDQLNDAVKDRCKEAAMKERKGIAEQIRRHISKCPSPKHGESVAWLLNLADCIEKDKPQH